MPDEPDDPAYAAAYRAFAAMRNLVLGSDDRRREVADATGLSFSRSRALRRLARKPMRMTELAAEMATDKPYTTLIVDDLERRGLVVRTVSPQDRRAKVVSVTDAGREMADLATHILSRPPTALRKAPVGGGTRPVGKAVEQDSRSGRRAAACGGLRLPRIDIRLA
ncbi:MarR family winged helix-turn-helix transcriptional regulator [Yinghuangia aomiensis]